MSGDILQPIVTALQGAVATTDIVNVFSSGVAVALPLILVWFGCKWVKSMLPIKNSVNA